MEAMPAWHPLVTTVSWSWAYLLAFLVVLNFALPVFCHYTIVSHKSLQGQWPHCIDASFFKRVCTMLLHKRHACESQHVADVSDGIGLGRGFLESLSTRGRARPKVQDIAADRPTSGITSDSMSEALSTVIHDFATTFPEHTYLGFSTFENNRPALFSRCPTYTDTRYFGEICRLNATDHSVHLILHPADARTVTEAGWAKRSPLPQDMKSLLFGWLTSTPVGLTIVHYPRDEVELQVVADILKAAVWWVSGVNANIASGDWP